MVVKTPKISSLDRRIEVHAITSDDELLATAYLRMRSEGILWRVYFHGVPSLKWFLANMSREDGVTYGCFVYAGDGSCEMAGIGWVSGVTQLQGIRRAEFGMAFFRKFWNAHTPEAFCNIMLDYAFMDGKFDAIYGHSSIENKGAVRISKACGFQQIRIPWAAYWRDHVTDEILSVMTKEDYYGRGT